MNEKYILYLEDILHTGHHGPEGESKVGEKYDRRRNTYCRIIALENNTGDRSILIIHYDSSDMIVSIGKTITTPFVEATTEDDYSYIRTVNSIYKFKREKIQ